jgi:hypothetical protein
MGAKFDPNMHDGIFQFDDPTKPAGTVGAVMKAGYMLHDRVMRPATVGTIRGVYVPPTTSTNGTPSSTSTESTPGADNSPSGAQS